MIASCIFIGFVAWPFLGRAGRRLSGSALIVPGAIDLDRPETLDGWTDARTCGSDSCGPAINKDAAVLSGKPRVGDCLMRRGFAPLMDSDRGPTTTS